MSQKNVNLSANDVLEHLNIKLESGWTSNADGEIDTVCFDSSVYALGFIVTLNMDTSKGTSFTVYEFTEIKESGKDYEFNDDFSNYDEALNFIRKQIDTCMEAE